MGSTALGDEPSDKTNDGSNEKQDTNDDDDDNLNAEVGSRNRAISTSITVVALASTEARVVSSGELGASTVVASRASVFGSRNPDERSSSVGAVAVVHSNVIGSIGGSRGLGKLNSGHLSALSRREGATERVISDHISVRSNKGDVSVSDVSGELSVKSGSLSSRDSNAPSSVRSSVNSVSELSVSSSEGEQVGGGSINQIGDGVGATNVVGGAGDGGVDGNVGSTGSVGNDSELKVPSAGDVGGQREEISRGSSGIVGSKEGAVDHSVGSDVASSKRSLYRERGNVDTSDSKAGNSGVSDVAEAV